MEQSVRISLPALTFAALAILLNSCSSVVTRSEFERTGIIGADSPGIQYVGRFDFSRPGKAVFDWAGVYIRARFTGTSCAVMLADSTDEYAVTVDDHAPKIFAFRGGNVHPIVAGLPDSVAHTITIQKKTEPLVGHGVFMGFVLDKGARLLRPEPRPRRRIEFIGNSITCGYGVLSDSSGCHFSPQTEDAGMSYAGQVARDLNADYSLISFSGKGVVRNYGDRDRISPDPMPSYYDRTCCFDSTLIWDFKSWVPQAVVINLGTNDFSTQPYPDSSEFKDAYGKLIDRVRALYPGVTVFCAIGPMVEEPCERYIRDVVREQQARGGVYHDVYFIDIPREAMTDDDWGCDMHPNVFGSMKMAHIIVPIIRLWMNW